MREIRPSRDRSVSEIIGTILVFSIVVSIFSSFVLWYVPYTGSQYEQNYENSSQSALQYFSDQLGSKYVLNGTTINQPIPMGIQGSFFSSPSQTELGFSPNNFKFSFTYNVSIGITYSGSSPASVALNTSKVVSNIPVGNNPDGVAVDTQNNYIYVINSNYSTLTTSTPMAGNMSVISGSTNKIIKTVPLDGFPTGITYDSNSNTVYVSEGNLSSQHYGPYGVVFLTGFVQIFNGNSATQSTHNIIFSSLPYDLAYIPYLNEVMVTSVYSYYSHYYQAYIYSGGGLSIINGTSQSITGFLQVSPVGNNTIPSSISYDPANGYVYVALGHHVAVFNPVTLSISKEIAVFSPWSATYDLANGSIFISSSQLNYNNRPIYGQNLSEYYGSNNTLFKEYTNLNSPDSLVYDQADRIIYVADFGSNGYGNGSGISMFSGTNGSFIGNITNYPNYTGPGNGPNAIAFDSVNDLVYVPNYIGGNVSVITGTATLNNAIPTSSSNSFPTNTTITSEGTVYTLGNTPFYPSNTFALQDGSVVDHGSSFGDLSGLPFLFNSTGGLLSFNARIINFTGLAQSISQSNSYLLTGSILNYRSFDWVVGSTITFMLSGIEYSAVISNIILNSFSFHIDTSYLADWNYSLYTKYNSSQSAFNSIPYGSSWNMPGLEAKVFVGTNNITISSTSPLYQLSSFGYDYIIVALNL